MMPRYYLCFMAEDLNIISGTKTEQYESLIPQIIGLLEGEPDLIANLANVCASLKEQFDWLWVGFYVVKPAFAEASAGANDELVLAPFQGRRPLFPRPPGGAPLTARPRRGSLLGSFNSAITDLREGRPSARHRPAGRRSAGDPSRVRDVRRPTGRGPERVDGPSVRG